MLLTAPAAAFDGEAFSVIVARTQLVRCAPVIVQCDKDIEVVTADMTDAAKFHWGQFCGAAGVLKKTLRESGYDVMSMVKPVEQELIRFRTGSDKYQQEWVKACVRTLLAR